MGRAGASIWAALAVGLCVAGCSPKQASNTNDEAVRAADVDAREAAWAAVALVERVSALEDALAQAQMREQQLLEKLAGYERSMDQLRAEQTKEAFARTPPAAPGGDVSLEGCQVIEVRPDLGVLAFSGGTAEGVRPEMLVNVLRGDRWVATVRVTDVRARVSGGRIEASSEKPAVGDRVTVRREAAP